MGKKRILMISGAAIIILFIGWFYIAQLGLLTPVSADKTTTAMVGNKESNNTDKVQEEDATLSRTDSQGAVAIQATILSEKSTSNQLFFKIEMNTHSVNLLQYQLDKYAQLSFGSTISRNGEFEWELISDDSHHVVGYLKWSGEVLNDRVILNLEDIDNIPLRTFIWEKSDLTKVIQSEN